MLVYLRERSALHVYTRAVTLWQTLQIKVLSHLGTRPASFNADSITPGA